MLKVVELVFSVEHFEMAWDKIPTSNFKASATMFEFFELN